MTEIPDGVASVCALGLPGALSDEATGKKVRSHLDKLQVICVPVPSDTNLVTVEVPPIPRLD
jgi:hypothetical protein